MNQITARIDGLRRGLDLSETRLASASGIPKTTLLRKLNNPAAFTIDELERLAGALQTSVSALIAQDVA